MRNGNKTYLDSFAYQHFGKRLKDLNKDEKQEYNNIKKLESRVPEFREKEREYHRNRYQMLKQDENYKEKRKLEARINRIKYNNTKKRQIEAMELALKMIEEDVKNNNIQDFNRARYIRIAKEQIIARDIKKYKEKRNIA